MKMFDIDKCILKSYLAASNVAVSVVPIAPKLTPTAKPSGILCTVIAMTSNIIRFHCDNDVLSKFCWLVL